MELAKLEDKYIELILKRCLNFERSKSLMINCELKEHIPFAEKVSEKAKEMGINDICIHLNDLYKIHEYLQNTPASGIVNNPIIDHTDWDVYARKGASLLFLETTVPGLMDDIEAEKIHKWFLAKESTMTYYRANVQNYVFPWTIVCLPNKVWARTVFKDDQNAYEKLYMNIMKMCMIDTHDPVASWEEFIKKSNYYKNRLNELQISELHYTNELGTDLTISLHEDIKWINLDKPDAYGNHMIVNMPSYEIFTSPDYRKTNGIVYSSRPLLYNGGLIDDFYIRFKDGEVIDYKAKVGGTLLKEMIFAADNSNYLGEVALVPYDSPISKTGLVYNETLFDENASCHLALGHGFKRCLPWAEKYTDEELQNMGLNLSKPHVDFMIGTRDLNIEAETKEGKVLVFKNGNFNI